MSDFVFSSSSHSAAELKEALQSIDTSQETPVRVFSGFWGSLGVLENHYAGFQPLETATHIAVVIGGPLLQFAENDFLDEADSSKGTEAVLGRLLSGEMQWDEDLSGPFAAFFLEKDSGAFTYVTDLLMFIPIYSFENEEVITLGSHVDVVARIAGQEQKLDLTSLADFVLNHVVTYPYTCYREIRQAEAGTIHTYSDIASSRQKSTKTYWLPREETNYESLPAAAELLRQGLLKDVATISSGTKQVAAFVSAGEDSRSILGSIPEGVACDGFTYLYGSPRDRAIARQVTETFQVKHTVSAQPYHYYLDILTEASTLVGSGHQYSHAHVVGFMEEWKLREYRAVLGGYLSDSLLKGLFSRKHRGRGLLSWLPEFPRSGETHTRRQQSELFTEAVLDEVQNRKREHMARVQEIRPKTAHEWFGIWPATMQLTFPNFLATRRLFRSYEPFMGKNSVKIGAGVPLTWKLNRRMFNRAVRPLLKPTRWIFHADGHLPYFPFWFNMPFVFLDKLKKTLVKAYHAFTCAITRKETPWQRRRASKTDAEWIAAFDKFEGSYDSMKEILKDSSARKKLSSRQTRNLLQLLEWIDRTNR